MLELNFLIIFNVLLTCKKKTSAFEVEIMPAVGEIGPKLFLKIFTDQVVSGVLSEDYLTNWVICWVISLNSFTS